MSSIITTVSKSIITAVSKPLYNTAAGLGWFIDPWSPYYNCVQPLKLTKAVGCTKSCQIYALVCILEDGTIIILKIGWSTNLNMTVEQQHNNLPLDQMIIIVPPHMLYDLEMEDHTTQAVQKLCEEEIIATDCLCPCLIKIIYDMVLKDRYHLALKPTVAHQLLECGLKTIATSFDLQNLACTILP